MDLMFNISNDNKIDRAKKLAGQYVSVQKDLSAKHDDYLAEAYK